MAPSGPVRQERAAPRPFLPWWAGSALFAVSLSPFLSFLPAPWRETWWSLLLVAAAWAIACQLAARLVNRLAARP